MNDKLLTISIDLTRSFISPMLASEDEGIRLCADNVLKTVDGLLKKNAEAASQEREKIIAALAFKRRYRWQTLKH